MTDLTCCPTCGRPWPSPIKTADHLVKLMLEHPEARDVYLGKKGGYFVSHGGGPVEKSAIDDAINRGLIVEKYPGEGYQYWKLADDTC